MVTTILFKVRVYQYALLGLLCLIGLSYYHRTAHFDEAWFAEESYWLTQNGWVRSELFSGYNGWGNRMYVFHKLFVYAGALVMGLTKFSLAYGKLLTPFFGCLTGWLIWHHSRRQPAEQRWIAVLLYFGCGTVVRYFFINRPEIMCMSLGFASYVALEHSPKRRSVLVLAGILAGLSAFTHLNGIVYLAAGAIWLFIRSGWLSVIWFSVAGALMVSLYGLDALLDGNVNVMVMQFLNDPATQSSLKLTDKLTVMANYHQLFFHSHGEVPLTVLTLLSLIIFRRSLRFNQPFILYLTLLVTSFWLISKSNFDFYYVLFVPWMALSVAYCLTTYLPVATRDYRTAAKWALTGYFLFSLFSVFKVLEENYTELYVPAYNAQLAHHMPRKHTKIIAPISFFWGQHLNYQIHGLTYYYLMERKKGPISLQTFFTMADRDSVNYVVSDGFNNASYDIPLNAPDTIGSYRRIFKDERSSIYSRFEQ